MNLSDLIAAYGDDKVQFQPLDSCADRMNLSQGATKITFGTQQPLGPDGMINMGIVVWMDRARVAEIIAADKAATKAAQSQIAQIEARMTEIHNALGDGPRQDWMRPLEEEYAFCRGQLSILRAASPIAKDADHG